jgi:hypothetical protein
MSHPSTPHARPAYSPPGFYCPSGAIAAYPCPAGTASGAGAAACASTGALSTVVGAETPEELARDAARARLGYGGGSTACSGCGSGDVRALTAALALADAKLKHQINGIAMTNAILQKVMFGEGGCMGFGYGFSI